MNAGLFPMSRRCRYCGTPLKRGRVCSEHRSAAANDPMYALEALLNTTGYSEGAAVASLASGRAQGGTA